MAAGAIVFRHCARALHAAFVALAVALLVGIGAVHAAPPQPLRPEVESFIDEMVTKHAFHRAPLRKLFRQAQPRPAVIRAISTPGTARPWHEFRANYIEERRIAAGVEFWRQHARALGRAQREYGVPEEVIVATIGVETFYGRSMGRFKVLEALSMLAFEYPPRAALFRSELEAFLLLTREVGLDPLTIHGSYAGAMGIPQFLPSSYRKYAVDFDGDGRPDIWRSPADAIGSVANYYRSFGWETGAPVVIEARAAGDEVDNVLAAEFRPHMRIAELRQRGIEPLSPVDEQALALLVRVEAEAGTQHWLGLQNFYVITRYNRSVNYALAVHELAQEVKARMGSAPPAQ
ncbi:MAG: lytic murein transglycosylase B [Betaproteobacteria bacterium]